MSKKGPRTDLFKAMTASLSEEIIAQYLEVARHVRDQELARQREKERRKEARKRARRALLESLGLLPPKRKKKSKKKKSSPHSSDRGTQTAKPAEEKAAKTLPKEKPARKLPKEKPAEKPTRKKRAARPGKGSSGRPAAAAPEETAPADKKKAARAAAGSATDGEIGRNKGPGQSKKPKPITREDILKLVIADELGYLDTVKEDGWGGLTTAQSGRVGGMMTRRMKRIEKGLPPV